MNTRTGPLIDCHLHLQEDIFAPVLDQVLARAAAAGVEQFVCNGSSEQDWPRVLDLGRRYPQMIPCFGLHPWYVKERSPNWLRQLETLLETIPSAIGEIGLDRWVEDRDEAAQEEVFRAQLQLARKLKRPVMVHCVRAWGWLMNVLESEELPSAGMLIHAYGGSAELIKPLAERGAWFSFAGNILDERHARGRQALLSVPHDRLLAETDAPDLLPPAPFRVSPLCDTNGRERNEPANLAPIVKGLARLIGLPEQDLARTLYTNSRRFLGPLLGPATAFTPACPKNVLPELSA